LGDIYEQISDFSLLHTLASYYTPGYDGVHGRPDSTRYPGEILLAGCGTGGFLTCPCANMRDGM